MPSEEEDEEAIIERRRKERAAMMERLKLNAVQSQDDDSRLSTRANTPASQQGGAREGSPDSDAVADEAVSVFLYLLLYSACFLSLQLDIGLCTVYWGLW